jgi:sulfite reductase (NADPH) flavoprotein alpha-component
MNVESEIMALQASNSPFNDQQVELLNRLLPTLSGEQTVWLDGYMAGRREAGQPSLIVAAAPTAGNAATAAATAIPRGSCETGSASVHADRHLPAVTVLYGSQTGNSARLAEQLVGRLQDRGFATVLSCMSQFPTKDLKKVKHLLVVVSTHGEGAPPDKAVTFHEFLHSRRAPRLEGVRFSVLALGDLTYKQFCKAGRDFDQRLAELGGELLYPRIDCDVDYEEHAEGWMEGVLTALGSAVPATATGNGSATPMVALAGGASTVAAVSATAMLSAPAARGYGRGRPFHAEVLENINLNGRGSDKETRLLTLSLRDSGLRFEPGDALGIYPQNHPELVDGLITEMGFRAEELVPVGKEERPLHEALSRHYEISALTRPLLQQAAVFSRDGLRDLVSRNSDDELSAFSRGRDLLDLVRTFPLRGVPAREFVGVLRKLPPRLYSIASSYDANPEEVELMIAALRYQAHNRLRTGTCSGYCAERVREGDRIPIYVHSNPNFRLPADHDTPMILVGPGTGVAPFRAFVQQREEVGARGKNWLFFGDRRFRTDFLCQREWLRWVRSGLLTHMHVAFSRDNREKVYVQQRMLEHSREIFAWLEEGAFFYVCGDEKRMAPDVHATLETIVQREGGVGPQQAKAYLADLQQSGRYQRDVY